MIFTSDFMKHKRLILLSALLLSSVIMFGQNFDLNEYRLSLEKEGEEIVPYTLVETKPTFNSEFHQDFLSWIYSNADSKILEGSNSGIANMTMFFVIERDGSLTNARVYQGISSDMDKELLKVVSHSPNWTPGLIQGRPFRTCLLLRIPISETYFSRTSGDEVLMEDNSAHKSDENGIWNGAIPYHEASAHPGFGDSSNHFAYNFSDWVLKYIWPDGFEATRDFDELRCRVKFIIEEDGSIGEISVVEPSVLEVYDNEVVRVIGNSPAWVPARDSDGNAIKTYVSIPFVTVFYHSF